MLANNNLKVCRTLVMRDFKFHPVKNTILILAAMLVTALYTLMVMAYSVPFMLNGIGCIDFLQAKPVGCKKQPTGRCVVRLTPKCRIGERQSRRHCCLCAFSALL